MFSYAKNVPLREPIHCAIGQRHRRLRKRLKNRTNILRPLIYHWCIMLYTNLKIMVLPIFFGLLRFININSNLVIYLKKYLLIAKTHSLSLLHLIWEPSFWPIHLSLKMLKWSETHLQTISLKLSNCLRTVQRFD